MEALWRVLGVAYAQLVVFRRQWMWIAQSYVVTLGMVFMLTFWGGMQALKHLVVALLVVSGWGIGLNIAAQDIGWDRVSNEYERRVASPLTLPEYVLGMVLGSFLAFFTSDLPLIVVLAYITGISLWGLFLVVLLSVVGMFLGLFLSLSVVLRIRNPMNISAVTNPLYTLTTTLPPVYYTPLMLPEPIRTACAAIPTTALVELGRVLTGQASAYPVVLPAASVAAWLIVTALLTVFKMKWGLE